MSGVKLNKEPQLTDTHGHLPHSHYIVPIPLLLTKKREKADEEKEVIFARNVHVIRVLFCPCRHKHTGLRTPHGTGGHSRVTRIHSGHEET